MIRLTDFASREFSALPADVQLFRLSHEGRINANASQTTTMTDNQLTEKLRVLIDYLATPAALISPSDKRVISSNSLMVRKFGPPLACGGRIEVSSPLDSSSSAPFFLTRGKGGEATVLISCPREEAEFESFPFGDSQVLILEPFQTKRISKPRPASENDTNQTLKPETTFHFTYMHNVGKGTWTYSDPAPLYAGALIDGGQDVKTLDWRQLILKEDLPLYENTVAAAVRHGGNHEIHYRVKTTNGDAVEVCDYCGSANPDGGWPILIGSVVLSPKERQNIQDAERQALVGRLIGGMVHDFKNLLTGIQNILEWCVARSVDNPEVNDALKETISYTERAAELINGTLRVSAGKRHNRIEKVHIADIIRDLESLIRRILPASTFLNIAVDNALPPMYGRRDLLQDMLLNLCVNAREAMALKGDRLDIEAYETTTTDQHGHDQQFVSLKVSDNGCGMSKSQLKAIFDAFYSTKDTGAGLGLWMVTEAVKAFDGDVEVRSELNEGSSFTIHFPVVERTLTPIEPAPTQRESTFSETPSIASHVFPGERTVLFIEDEPLIKSGVSSWLESWGFNLLSVEDGAKGLELFNQHHDDIDVVIQDFFLPGIKGDELLKSFQAKRPELPVIVTSANQDEERVNHMKELGAYAFLRKPFRMQDLFKLLYEILE